MQTSYPHRNVPGFFLGTLLLVSLQCASMPQYDPSFRFAVETFPKVERVVLLEANGSIPALPLLDAPAANKVLRERFAAARESHQKAVGQKVGGKVILASTVFTKPTASQMAKIARENNAQLVIRPFYHGRMSFERVTFGNRYCFIRRGQLEGGYIAYDSTGAEIIREKLYPGQLHTVTAGATQCALTALGDVNEELGSFVGRFDFHKLAILKK